jgi:hypothetical protein
MSLEIQAKIICDGCGETRLSEVEFRSTRLAESLWGLEYRLEKDGWMKVRRGKCSPYAHYCPNCTDKPMKRIPRRKKPNHYSASTDQQKGHDQ